MNKKLIGIVVIIAAAGLIAYFVTRSQAPYVATPAPQPPQPTSNIPAISKSASSSSSSTSKLATKSKPSTPAVVTGVVLSKAITASGAPLNPVTTFSSNTPTIYAVLTLKNAVQRTELSYIRYYEGKYVDAKVSHPTRDGVRYFHFKFALKSGQTRKAGHYKLTFYVNGKKTQSADYVVR